MTAFRPGKMPLYCAHCGDPNYTDNWIDLVGYAQLVVNRLEKEENAA